MSQSKRKRSGQVVARDDQGREYEIIEYTNIHDVGTFGDPNASLEGLKEYQLSDGSFVNKISETEFEIVTSGVKLHVTS